MSEMSRTSWAELAELNEKAELNEQAEISWAEQAKKTNARADANDLISTKSPDLVTPKEVATEKQKNVLKIAEIESEIEKIKKNIEKYKKNIEKYKNYTNENTENDEGDEGVDQFVQDSLCAQINKYEKSLEDNEEHLKLLYRNKVTLDNIQFTGLEICKRSIRGNHNFYPNLLKYIVESIQAEVGDFKGVEVEIQDVLDYFNFIHEYDECETQRALLDHIMRRFLNVILGHHYGTNGDGEVPPHLRLGIIAYGQKAAFRQPAYGQKAAFRQPPRGNITYADQAPQAKQTRVKSARKGRKY